jgi:hypothetical protein
MGHCSRIFAVVFIGPPSLPLSSSFFSLCRLNLPILANGQRDGANYDECKKVWTSYTAIPVRSKRYADRKSLDNVVIFMVTRRTGYGARALQTRECRMLSAHTEAINFAKCIEVRYKCVYILGVEIYTRL